MKFAIITDIHHGMHGTWIKWGVPRKLVTKAKWLVKNFVEQINNLDDVEFVLNMGDLIEDVNDKSKDIELFQEALSVFDALRVPHKFVIGNHDQKTLRAETLSSLLWTKDLYYSFVVGTFKFIILRVEYLKNYKETWSIASRVSSEQIEWLKHELLTDKKCIIVSHYPLSDVNLEGNFRFESKEKSALLGNRKEIRNIFSEHKNILACFNGHIHCNNITYHDNIPYITQQSVSENFIEEEIPAATYSIVEVTDEKLNITMHGNDRLNITHYF